MKGRNKLGGRERSRGKHHQTASRMTEILELRISKRFDYFAQWNGDRRLSEGTLHAFQEGKSLIRT